jgi:hypothetical protein
MQSTCFIYYRNYHILYIFEIIDIFDILTSLHHIFNIYIKVICMMVKDAAGQEFNAASNGKANAGLTLGM